MKKIIISKVLCPKCRTLQSGKNGTIHLLNGAVFTCSPFSGYGVDGCGEVFRLTSEVSNK